MTHSGTALLALTIGMFSFTAQADSLRDIYELALENDAQLKSEEAQYLANLENETLSRSALLPQINANYDYTDSDQDREGESFEVTGGGITAIDTFTNTDVTTDGYQVSLSQALFDLPAWFSFQSGKEFTRQAEATFAANQQNITVQVSVERIGRMQMRVTE